jgi:uncharacterized protein YdcH (DUF465 family)
MKHWHEEYTRIAPRPEDFDKLFAKTSEMDKNIKNVPAETIEAMTAPSSSSVTPTLFARNIG